MLSSSDVELAVEVLETVGGCELWLTIRLEETEMRLVIDSESRPGVIGLGMASLEVVVLLMVLCQYCGKKMILLGNMVYSITRGKKLYVK